MRQWTFFLLLAASLRVPPAGASDLALSIRKIEGPGWRAEGVEVKLIPPNVVQLDIATVVFAGQPPIREFHLRCRDLQAGQGARCDNAVFTATVPGRGKLEGRLRGGFHNALRWNAELEIPSLGLRAVLTQAGAEIAAELSVRDFTTSEASGRYATEKLAMDARLRWHRGSGRLEFSLDTLGGQAYAEPVFLDFGALPLKIEASLLANAQGWAVEHLSSVHGKAGKLEASGQVSADFKPTQMELSLEAADLAPLVAMAAQPFLIGTRLDDVTAAGSASAQVSWREGAVQNFLARFTDASFKATKLGLALDGIAGELNWAIANAAPSKLQWQTGAMQRVPLGASAISFHAQGKDFELLAPWRQPLLEGALKVERLALRSLGTAQLDADFAGALEPINLAALCTALGWPQFSGMLGGRLPGLSVRDEVWTVDGTLEAQAFDGSLRVANLRAIQPFGVLPRVMADLSLRRLDLERLTGTFSFGRITGRLDGDITGLRLLNWNPVAFDGRLYSTPDDDTKRRISQRAIDNISAIGGGPTGILSRGFLSVFEDFAYERLGLSCVLRDGVCQMDGVEPAGSEGDQKAYYLVKGRLLPRIDVVGYAQRVSWNNLIEQLKSAQASGGPKLSGSE